MEEHSLLLHSDKTFVQPRPRCCPFTPLHLDHYHDAHHKDQDVDDDDDNDENDDDDDNYVKKKFSNQLFTANRHLETAVDDLASRPDDNHDNW